MNDTAHGDETAALLTSKGFTFTDQTPPARVTDGGLASGDEPSDAGDEDDPEFQPRTRRRLHWLTIVLISLTIWGAGFLAGVLVDRAVAGLLG